jgi:DNA-binding NtrC family response regulator
MNGRQVDIVLVSHNQHDCSLLKEACHTIGIASQVTHCCDRASALELLQRSHCAVRVVMISSRIEQQAIVDLAADINRVCPGVPVVILYESSTDPVAAKLRPSATHEWIMPLTFDGMIGDLRVVLGQCGVA